MQVKKLDKLKNKRKALKSEESPERLGCQFLPDREKLKALEKEYPDFRCYYFEAFQSLFQLANEIQKMMELYHAKNGFSRARYLTLIALFHEGGKLTPNEIANRMNVTRGNMTGLIDYLLKDGLVKKYQDEKDRRQVWIEMTPKGEAHLRKIFPDYFKRLSRIMTEVSKQEVNDFIRVARKLHDVLPKFWESENPPKSAKI